jgi:hypothetical protein
MWVGAMHSERTDMHFGDGSKYLRIGLQKEHRVIEL